MKKPTPIYITARRFAQLERIEKSTLLMRLKRTGSNRGVVGHKLQNGEWAFSAADVYAALGLFDESNRPAAQCLQDRAIEATGAELLAVHRVVRWLHRNARHAPTARQEIDEMHADLRDHIALLEAHRGRVGHAFGAEEEMTDLDFEKNYRFAAELERTCSKLVENLRWRTPGTASKTSEGLALDRASDPVDIRSFSACLEAFGLPENDATLRAFGTRSLTHEVDSGRDPAYLLDEMAYLYEANSAAVSRLFALLGSMEPKGRRRAQTLARLIAEVWSSVADEAIEGEGSAP